MNGIKLLLIIFVAPACVFAEDVSEAFGGKEPPPFGVAERLPIVIHQNSMMFFLFNYQFLDGIPLAEGAKLRQILRAVPQINENLNNIILTEKNMSGASYKFAGGMPLGYADIYKVTAGVANNDVIIKKAERWRAASMGFASLSAIASVFAVGGLIQGEEKLSRTGLYAAIGTFIWAIIAGDLCQQNTQKAVNNYNLYIMGIPVK
ncbi:MAG: hypothetical protein LBD58_04730 [Treponema sp.]|jgi:hypothetical protein|nr:hypothetical protein [Treponema sp.]